MIDRPSVVLVDLDDTLYPQAEWLAGAWEAVAAAAEELGAPRDDLLSALQSIAGEGSDRGRIIDRSLERIGRSDMLVAPLVESFLSHRPIGLHPYPGVVDALGHLQDRTVVIVTDGVPEIQRHKVAALGISHLVDHVVVSDDAGREYRKPDPHSLKVGLELANAVPADAVMIGDRPEKDVAAAHALGVHAIRVRTGEYATRPDEPMADAVVDSFAAAVALIAS